MQQQPIPAGPFKIITEQMPAAGSAPPLHVSNGFAPVIDLKTYVSPVLRHPLEKPVNLALKRIIDVFISLLVTALLLCWLIPLIALLIKADSRGPVFFLQKRNKRRGNQFRCIKFRSMVANADADILPAGKNDRRITRVGKFLRRHYLDELPQFINVLLGDMSVIGPRPHMVNENIKFDGLIKNYCSRHKVKPGITGLAQVMGYEGEITDLQKMKGRVNMDVFYIRHWSLRMDMAILYRTFCKTLGF